MTYWSIILTWVMLQLHMKLAESGENIRELDLLLVYWYSTNITWCGTEWRESYAENKKIPSNDNRKPAKIYSMQIYYTEADQNTYPFRPKAGLRSCTNVVDGDDVADLKVVKWKKTAPSTNTMVPRGSTHVWCGWRPRGSRSSRAAEAVEWI